MFNNDKNFVLRESDTLKINDGFIIVAFAKFCLMSFSPFNLDFA